MIRALIVNPYPILRKGIVQSLSEDSKTQVVAEAEAGREALNLVTQQDIDVVVLDIDLPDMNGLEFIKRALTLKPSLKVLVLSQHSEERYAVQAIQNRASGYLSVACSLAELLAAVHKIARDGMYITPSVAVELAHCVSLNNHIPHHQLLTAREYQVMRMLASGTSVTGIAAQISLSVKTISTYRARILEKLGVKNTAGIIRYALLNKLVD